MEIEGAVPSISQIDGIEGAAQNNPNQEQKQNPDQEQVPCWANLSLAKLMVIEHICIIITAVAIGGTIHVGHAISDEPRQAFWYIVVLPLCAIMAISVLCMCVFLCMQCIELSKPDQHIHLRSANHFTFRLLEATWLIPLMIFIGIQAHDLHGNNERSHAAFSYTLGALISLIIENIFLIVMLFLHCCIHMTQHHWMKDKDERTDEHVLQQQWHLDHWVDFPYLTTKTYIGLACCINLTGLFLAFFCYNIQEQDQEQNRNTWWSVQQCWYLSIALTCLWILARLWYLEIILLLNVQQRHAWLFRVHNAWLCTALLGILILGGWQQWWLTIDANTTKLYQPFTTAIGFGLLVQWFCVQLDTCERNQLYWL